MKNPTLIQQRVPNLLRFACPPFAALLLLLLASCSPLHLDLSARPESTLLPLPATDAATVAVDAPTRVLLPIAEIHYRRTPEQGPVSASHTAWWLAWNTPMNHPDLQEWIAAELLPGELAANIRAKVWMPWYAPLVSIPTLGFFRVQRVEFAMDPVTIEWIEPKPRAAAQPDPEPETSIDPE